MLTNILLSFIVLNLLSTFGISDYIINDSKNGNSGQGINNLINGTNNSYMGNQNTINGIQNTVNGNSNSITGSQNYV
jgi:hypothetical protein